MTLPKTPFTIYGLAPEGFTVVTHSVNAITSTGVTLYVGDTLEVTDAIYELSRDRNGDSFLEYTDAEQIARWGLPKFGVGEVPAQVTAMVEVARRQRLQDEAGHLKRVNPHLARATAASARLDAINAELAN